MGRVGLGWVKFNWVEFGVGVGIELRLSSVNRCIGNGLHF